MRRILSSLVCWTLCVLAARPGAGGVVVLQNWTRVKIEYAVRQADGRLARRSIAQGDIASFPTAQPIELVMGEGPAQHACTLEVNSIYYFGTRGGVPDLARLNLPAAEKPAEASVPAAAAAGPPQPGATTPAPAQAADEPYKIPVAILVDSADPRIEAAWEKRVRKRFTEASDIFEHHCRVRFEIVKVGNWVSDPATRSFDQALLEFAQKVRPQPARLAVGFTNQYDWAKGETHLGGTHGALASHILIRESHGRVTEPERLEILVHELGHFLGAAHTSDQASVMRPMLGDRRSAAKSFRIGFDAPNTLVISLIAEEMRTRRLWHPSALSPAAKDAVRGAYTVLGQTLPQDPVSASALESLGPPPRAAPAGPGPGIIVGARIVALTVVQAAGENQKLPVRPANPRAPAWRTEDELATYYVRRAAGAAQHLSRPLAPTAFLLGLGVTLDDSNFVRDKPALSEVWKQVAPEEQRQAWLAALGTPTMHKRHSVAGHFALSAALAAISGPQAAEAAGLAREILDSRSGGHFSFSDLCADMAGITFATHVREENIRLADLAAGFKIADYVPAMDGLPDDLSWDAFQKQYGEPGSEGFQRQRADIYRRILALPAYRPPQTAKKP